MNNNQISEKKTGIFYSLALFIYSVITSLIILVINSIIQIIQKLLNLFYKILLELLFNITHTINIFVTVSIANFFVIVTSYVTGLITGFLLFRSSKKSE